jgi:hypothetical protein
VFYRVALALLDKPAVAPSVVPGKAGKSTSRSGRITNNALLFARHSSASLADASGYRITASQGTQGRFVAMWNSHRAAVTFAGSQIRSPRDFCPSN